jgi:peptidoglycan hydrolase-like protein with peptidoglycan-binding domain
VAPRRRSAPMFALGFAVAAGGTAAAEGELPSAAERLREAALLARAELAFDALGYRIDSPDGLPDPLTSHALARFRRDAGLPAETAVDGQLAAVLEAAVALRTATNGALATARRAAEERLVRAAVRRCPASGLIRRPSPRVRPSSVANAVRAAIYRPRRDGHRHRGPLC